MDHNSRPIVIHLVGSWNNVMVFLFLVQFFYLDLSRTRVKSLIVAIKAVFYCTTMKQQHQSKKIWRQHPQLERHHRCIHSFQQTFSGSVGHRDLVHQRERKKNEYPHGLGWLLKRAHRNHSVGYLHHRALIEPELYQLLPRFISEMCSASDILLC